MPRRSTSSREVAAVERGIDDAGAVEAVLVDELEDVVEVPGGDASEVQHDGHAGGVVEHGLAEDERVEVDVDVQVVEEGEDGDGVGGRDHGAEVQGVGPREYLGHLYRGFIPMLISNSKPDISFED